MHTLSVLTAHPPYHTSDSSIVSGYTSNTPSLFASFAPLLHGRGPIGTAFRILVKINHQLFSGLPSVTYDTFGMGSGSKKKDEDMLRRSIKVVDLLQHSADLGNMDALYTLAHISLVRLTTASVVACLSHLH